MNKTHEIITEHILKALDQEILPWKQPWKVINSFHRNGTTNRSYNGINVLMCEVSCLLQGFSDQRWYTFNNVKQLQKSDKYKEIRVIKGSESTPIVFYKTWDVEDEETGEKKTRRILQYSRVFNREQISDWPEDDSYKGPENEFAEIHTAEEIVEGFEDAPTVKLGNTAAYYLPNLDQIHIPAKGDFLSSEEYYATLFHEFGHSTGHPTRLDRSGIKEEITKETNHRTSYSREELVAELCSSILCAESGIDTTVDNSKAYIQSWGKNLREHPEWIIGASRDAVKAARYIMGIEESN